MAEGLLTNPYSNKLLNPTGAAGTSPGLLRQQSAFNPSTYYTKGFGSSEKETLDPRAIETEGLVENYKALAGSMLDRQDFMPPIRAAKSPATDIANIFLGDELNALGFSLDEEGLSWKMDMLKDAWLEHPIRSTIALASYALPGIGAAAKATGKGSMAAAGILAKGSTVIDHSVESFKSAKLIDDSVDTTRMGEEFLEKAGIHHKLLTERRARKNRIMDGQGSRMDQFRENFDIQFGNSYADAVDPYLEVPEVLEFNKRMQDLTTGKSIGDLMHQLPADRYGPAIARFVMDPNEFNKLPDAVKPWAMKISQRLRDGQRAMVEDGIITPDTLRHVGPAYFSTQRVGTKYEEAGAFTNILMGLSKQGKAKLLKAPRTGSGQMLPRAATQADVRENLNISEAYWQLSDGKTARALEILRGRPELAAVKKSVQDGDVQSAMTKLLATGKVMETTPESLVTRSLLQQDVLLNNFRYWRDLAMSPHAIKRDKFSQFSKSLQKEYVNMDKLENSNILRRMIAKKTGTDPTELGYVHRSLLKEMDLQRQIGGALGGPLMELATAVHKISKTAMNPATHITNFVGNTTFMMMGGFNPFKPENYKIMRNSWKMIRDIQTARRKGEGEIGQWIIKSKAGGADINILEELQNPMLRDLLEDSNFLTTEGVQILSRIANKSENAGEFASSLAKFMNTSMHKTVLPEKMADWYMAEDMAAKLAYYAFQRQNGLSVAGSAMEVARRLPVYNSVGKQIQKGRRVVFPWLTFPAEAMRIMKNGIVDYPLRAAALIHSSDFMQAAMYPAMPEGTTSLEEMRGIRRDVPNYAQRPSEGAAVLPWKDRNGDFRQAVLDWLPFASFMPKQGEGSRKEDLLFKLAGEASPVGTPFPIITNMVYAMTGRTAWGDKIADDPDNPVDNLLGFLAPPLAQKYALASYAPDLTYRIGQDIGMKVNPRTERPGDWLYDAILNNLGAGGKYYASVPEQGLFADNLTNESYSAYRSKLKKDFRAHVLNDDSEAANETFEDYLRTFSSQYAGDPELATKKSMDAIKRDMRTFMNHPSLRAMSKEELMRQLEALEATGVGKRRSQALARRISVIRKELATRAAQRRR
jgi:hypothetical protein